MPPYAGPAILLALVLVEILILKYFKRVHVPWAEITDNLNSGHILLWVIRGVSLIIYAVVFRIVGTDILVQLPLWLQIFIGVIAWDFLWYCSHYAHHKIKALWSVHIVHHQGESYNLSLGIRNSWYSALTSIVFFLPLAFLGLPLDVFILVSSINYFIQFYNHTTLFPKTGWVDYLLITPAVHKVHHGMNPEYIDKNYGGTFSVWDRMFGTFQREISTTPIELGCADKVDSSNPFWINNDYLFKLVGLGKKSQGTQVANRLYSDALIFTGGVFLFLILLLFIADETTWSIWLRIYVIAMLLICTLVLGELQNGRSKMSWAWMVSCAALCLPILEISMTPVTILCTSLLMAHSLLVLSLWLRGRSEA